MIHILVNLGGVSDSDVRLHEAALSDAQGHLDRASVAGVLVSLAHAFGGERARRVRGAPGGEVTVPLAGAEVLSEIERSAVMGLFLGWREQAVQERKPALAHVWHTVLAALADARDAERATWKRIERDFRFPGSARDDEKGETAWPLPPESSEL